MAYRLHVVGLPHTQTTSAFSSCAYTEKVRKFCKMMMAQGNEVFLYAGAKNEAPCTEHIPCITEKERKLAVGRNHYTEASWDITLAHWVKFNINAAMQMKARVQPKDFICVIGGKAHKPIADMFPNHMVVEFGVGYSGTFSRYRVWESYAWMHMCYGAQAPDAEPTAVDGKWFDAVIPSYLEQEAFHLARAPKDYALYIGRMVDRKGVGVAIQACEAAGIKLITAGPGAARKGAHHKGVVGPDQRAQLMAEAQVVLVPTQYVEPFGNVAIEAMASGTPVLTTDWGAFTETVRNGQNGFRCRTLKEFVDGITLVKELDRSYIRSSALARYSLEAIRPQYQSYFDRLTLLWGKGWSEGVTLA
jgi:glycosyltransferase involved in cell wall biosynthesis